MNQRIRKWHLPPEEPGELSRCGLDVVYMTPRRERATCKRCLRTKSAVKAKTVRRAQSRRYYLRHRERILARVKAYSVRPEVYERRQEWLKANRYRIADRWMERYDKGRMR